MKKIKLFAGLLFAFALVIGMSVAAFAYEYTVTVSGGAGTVDGAVVPAEVPLGGTVSLPTSTPDDPKYVFKGYYISGREGTLYTTTYAGVDGKGIQKDTDLVAAYGVPGDMYKYTVNYVNQATGAPLHDPEEFYANEGDNLVVVYRYVEGYLPTTYSQSKTISATEPNVFTFEYNPAPTSEIIVIDEGGAGGGGAPAAPAAPGAPVVPGGGGAPAGGGGEEIEPEPTPLGPGGGGEEIETEPAPLGPGGESQPEPGPGPEPGKPGSALPWAIGGGAAVVIAAAIGIIVGVKKKKK